MNQSRKGFHQLGAFGPPPFRLPAPPASVIEGPEPGGREVVRPVSLRYAFQWLRELPEQIERTVIAGGLAAQRTSAHC
jgi:hypothetical protein